MTDPLICYPRDCAASGRCTAIPSGFLCRFDVPVANGADCLYKETRNPEEEWVDPTRAVLAFYEEDADEARDRIDAILDRGWSDWKLVTLVQDLQSLTAVMDEDKRDLFEEMIKEVAESLPIAQNVLKDRVLSRIKDTSQSQFVVPLSCFSQYIPPFSVVKIVPERPTTIPFPSSVKATPYKCRVVPLG